MILVLGVGIVGRAVIQHFKNLGHDVCFFDDNVKAFEDIQFFNTWDKVDLVIASPGIALSHDMMQEARRRNIKITNDVEIFLQENPDGIKIGITGTNGKSTTCALLKHILGERAEIGGNFGVSPLQFKKSEYYIIELSSYQLELMEPESLHLLDYGLITNIYPNHIARHGSFEDYTSAKCKILNAKNVLLGHCDFFADWEFHKAAQPQTLPDAELFQHKEYQYCWAMIEYIINALGLNIQDACEQAKSYKTLKYRQEEIATKPVKVINDSKSTNAIAAQQALDNFNEPVCWIAGGAGSSDWSQLANHTQNVKKVFVYTPELAELINALESTGLEYETYTGLEAATEAAFEFAKLNKLTLICSPGYPSYGEFKHFEERGAFFEKCINKLVQL